MRRVAILTATIVTLSGPAFAQDNATVQRLADHFAEAFNSNAATGVGELYSDEAILVPPGADIRMGRKDIQAFWVQQAKLAEALSLAVLDVKPLGPDVARAVVRGEMVTKGAKPQHLAGRNVVVLQKVGADWKLAAHVWNYGSDWRTDLRDSSERDRRRDLDGHRARERDNGDPDVSLGRERSEVRRDPDDRWLIPRRDRGYGGRHSSSGPRREFQPRYSDDYED
jgi:uncharacterized protein (TIGR02246 family)